MDVLEKVDIFFEDYLKNNFEKIKMEEYHKNTELYYLYSKKDKNFLKFFKMSALVSLARNGEIKLPLISEPLKCNNCGKYINFILNDNIISSEDIDCFNEKKYSVNIKIPSGKLILADWPEFMSDIINIKDLDINSLIGRVNQSKNYEKENIMHFFVGNTSPLVSQKNNEINMESVGYNDEIDEEIFYDETFKIKEKIYTDLWWVTGIDFDLYHKLLEEKVGKYIFSDSEYKKFIKNCLILDVEPGEYTCISYFELYKHDEDFEKSKLFIKIMPKDN